jgi:hypothetical protein
MKYSVFCAIALTFLLSGCAATEILSRHMPSDAAQSIHIYSRNEETSVNLIDLALANCADGTEQAETACIREALSRASLSTRALVSLIPGCSLGAICTYDHTTRRRLGLLPMYSSVVKKDWRVTIDLRRDVALPALPPIVVTDRNVFVVPPSRVTPTIGPMQTVAR